MSERTVENHQEHCQGNLCQEPAKRKSEDASLRGCETVSYVVRFITFWRVVMPYLQGEGALDYFDCTPQTPSHARRFVSSATMLCSLGNFQIEKKLASLSPKTKFSFHLLADVWSSLHSQFCSHVDRLLHLPAWSLYEGLCRVVQHQPTKKLSVWNKAGTVRIT